MARYKCEKVVQGLNGDVIAGASVSVYLSGTNIPAKVYLTKDATSGVDMVPQLQTDGGGVFRFWVDSADYDYKQRFRIEVVKDNFSVVVDDVKIVEEDDWLDGIISGSIQTVPKDGSVTTAKIADGAVTERKISASGSLVMNLNADKLDGYDASQTPSANTIPVAGADGKLDKGWLPVTIPNWVYLFAYYNIPGAL